MKHVLAKLCKPSPSGEKSKGRLGSGYSNYSSSSKYKLFSGGYS